MVVKSQKQISALTCALLLAFPSTNVVLAADAEGDILFQAVTADACDDRQADDDKHTAENRAIDSACLIAIKTSGLLQQRYPKLGVEALDLVSYRLIDEYLIDVKHKITLNDDKRVCVKVNASIEITPDDLNQLVKEYKNISHFSDEGIAEAAEKVQDTFKAVPNEPDEKQLVYITPMVFYDGTETNHYEKYLKELFNNNSYFFVTDDLKLADYIVTPRLVRAEVDEMDANNNKMRMMVELDTAAPNKTEFMPLSEQQNHFILFATDKNEQKIADTLLKKLLSRAAITTITKLEKAIQEQLETTRKKELNIL